MIKHISIEYCVMWNYLPKAASLADTLKRELGVDAELIESSGGVFEVVADGELIFSKKKEKRHPSHEEVLESLQHV